MVSAILNLVNYLVVICGMILTCTLGHETMVVSSELVIVLSMDEYRSRVSSSHGNDGSNT